MIYLNNQIISKSDARIHFMDRGFLLGDGLFETIRCEHGKLINFLPHWQRLNDGLEFCQIPCPITENQLRSICEQTLSANQLENSIASLRITLTRGPTSRGINLPTAPKPTLMVKCDPLPKNIADPISVCTTNYMRNEKSPLCRFKTLNYLEPILARQQAKQNGYDDALLINTKEEVICGTVANLFIVENKTLYTPPLSSGPLPGTTRQQIIDLAKKINIPFKEKPLTQTNLPTIKEAFFTNSLIGIQPIHKINEHPLTSTHPNSLTSQLI